MNFILSISFLNFKFELVEGTFQIHKKAKILEH